ncbi:MAG: hypothetical protein QJR09_11950 [Micrococcus sp.]|nr:hypothetical protein [Micrococcus sp.]
MRLVVILCGPPGAGKTTAARQAGLTVFDRDDPQWHSEKDFTDALARLAEDPRAMAVVIRSGATSSARRRWSRLVNATHVYVITTEQHEARRRVHQRSRGDERVSMTAITQWFDRHDRDDGVQDFPGWSALWSPSIGLTSTDW